MHDDHVLSESPEAPQQKPRPRELGGGRVPLLAAVGLLAGIGIGSIWLYRTNVRPAAPTAAEPTSEEQVVTLSAGTKAVLQRLNSQVEIRFYTLLDAGSTPESLRTFAARAGQLLAAYEQEAKGKIRVVRHSRSDSKASLEAAAADGIKPFPTGQGQPAYLGLVVVNHAQKEVLPQLAAEWEQALESDLSRAIAHLINAPSQTAIAVAAAQVDPAVAAEVKRQIPNFASVSVEEGTRILRESARKEFEAMAGEMETQIKEAEKRVSEAQQGKSASELQAALQQLQQVRADQAAKLQQTTAKSAAQIEALRRMIDANR